MNAANCTVEQDQPEINKNDNSDSKSARKLETRRRIEDIFEEKRLRKELDLDY